MIIRKATKKDLKECFEIQKPAKQNQTPMRITRIYLVWPGRNQRDQITIPVQAQSLSGSKLNNIFSPAIFLINDSS